MREDEKPLTAEEIKIISDVLNIHPDPIGCDSVYELSTNELVNCMRIFAAQQCKEKDKEIENLKVALQNNKLLTAIEKPIEAYLKYQGACMEKNCENLAEIDYDGSGYYVCKTHYNNLSSFTEREII